MYVKKYDLNCIKRLQMHLNVVSHFPIIIQREFMLELTEQRRSEQTCAQNVLNIREPCQRYLTQGLALEMDYIIRDSIELCIVCFLFDLAFGSYVCILLYQKILYACGCEKNYNYNSLIWLSNNKNYVFI